MFRLLLVTAFALIGLGDSALDACPFQEGSPSVATGASTGANPGPADPESRLMAELDHLLAEFRRMESSVVENARDTESGPERILLVALKASGQREAALRTALEAQLALTARQSQLLAEATAPQGPGASSTPATGVQTATPARSQPHYARPYLSPAKAQLVVGQLLLWRMSCGGQAEIYLHDDGWFCLHETHGRRRATATVPQVAFPSRGSIRFATLAGGEVTVYRRPDRTLEVVRH